MRGAETRKFWRTPESHHRSGRIVKWAIEPRTSIECAHGPEEVPPEMINLIEDSREREWLLYVDATNNEAENEALANGLTFANTLETEHIHIQSDSQLLVGNVKGDFSIDKTKERLVGYVRRVRKLAKLTRRS
ncbi:hypothetical protein LIER_37987 [Lithospermum erythrorhizon]|uniref:RNase H type-1 domain-containing protein n=1 Tax=Lithospermum erythrorhizon TaxID=34254 RepID=A0AAV3PV04_LITER